MNKNSSIDEQISSLESEIEKLNNECANEISSVLGSSTGRILSFEKQNKINSVIEQKTAKLSKMIVDLEELKDVKKMLEEDSNK